MKKMKGVFAFKVKSAGFTDRTLVLQDGANIVKKMKGVFAFKVKNAGGQEGVWIVDAKNGKGAVKFGANGECLLSV